MNRIITIILMSIACVSLTRGVLAAEVHEDTDRDGLTDDLERAFGSDPNNPDTDHDGYRDGLEIEHGFSPTSSSTIPLPKSLVVHIGTQTLEEQLGGISIATYSVSTGTKNRPTPIGRFSILSKQKRAWSKIGKLWMPWWMQVTRQGVGIHELPEWPNGKKEGADHLGKPASHGCIRLGIGAAKQVYDWTPLGTRVTLMN